MGIENVHRDNAHDRYSFRNYLTHQTDNLFAPQQYGFRKNSSTELAALEFIDRLLNQMNNHKIPTNFYIDLSKAFDSLQHDILLEKLAHYGLTNKAIALLKSYLSNRK